MSTKPQRPSPERLRELRHLIARLCDDTLQPQEAARLEELVTTDEGCCDYYITCMHIDATLPRYVGAIVGDADSLSGELQERASLTSDKLANAWTQSASLEDSCIAEDSDEIRQALTPAATSSSTRSSLFRSPSQQSHSYLQIFSAPGVLGVVVGVLATVAIGLIVYRPWLGQPQVSPSPETAAQREATFPAFSSVQLQSGSVKLGIDKVGWVLVDGPTDFDLIGPMRARLNYGRIQMRVTESTGRGFVIETPDGDVTDLGTEFGLEVSRGGNTGLVVFEGAVDLRVANAHASQVGPAERLVGGEGVAFNRGGESARIGSIFTGIASTFSCRNEVREDGTIPVILDVIDNLSSAETKKYYEIVAGGLREDAKAYVDRPEHEWNGVTQNGMPAYLVGADYVKPFNSDKVESAIEISVTLGRPATLYVFFDDRVKNVPGWLQKHFRKTGDKIGLDGGDWSGSKIHSRRGDGPGVSIDDQFSVWELVVKEPGVVKLGPNTSKTSMRSIGMYGIAAVALNPGDKPPQQTATSVD